MAEEIEIKPMISKQLVELREGIDDNLVGLKIPVPVELAAKLLAAHDFFRNRADVNARDVEAAGITVEKCEAWLAQNGWFLASYPSNRIRNVWEKVGGRECSGIWPTSRPASRIAVIITLRARDTKRPAFDILEEMAAL